MDQRENRWTPHRPQEWPARYATIMQDIRATKFHGWENGEACESHWTIKAGTRVKIVMASRFGDVGITDDLLADHGYVARCELDQLKDLSMNAEGTDQ